MDALDGCDPLCSGHSHHCVKTATMAGDNPRQVGLPGIVVCL